MSKTAFGRQRSQVRLLSLRPTNSQDNQSVTSLPQGGEGQCAPVETTPPRLKYITHDTDRHGNRRVYFRRGRRGQKIRIRAKEGSEEFDAIYAGLLQNKAPQPPKRKFTGAFVYVIGSKNGPFKIGVASDLEKRLCSIQTGNPRHLSVRHACMVADMGIAREMEVALHKHFAAMRRAGEWFCVSVTAVKSAICDIAWEQKFAIRQAQVPPPKRRRKSLCRILSAPPHSSEMAT